MSKSFRVKVYFKLSFSRLYNIMQIIKLYYLPIFNNENISFFFLILSVREFGIFSKRSIKICSPKIKLN
jgi:hypothetical protein